MKKITTEKKLNFCNICNKIAFALLFAYIIFMGVEQFRSPAPEALNPDSAGSTTLIIAYIFIVICAVSGYFITDTLIKAVKRIK